VCDCRSHNGFLTAKGLIEAALREDALHEILAMEPFRNRSVEGPCKGSMSGLERERDLFMYVPDVLMDEQYQRFLNGS